MCSRPVECKAWTQWTCGSFASGRQPAGPAHPASPGSNDTTVCWSKQTLRYSMHFCRAQSTAGKGRAVNGVPTPVNGGSWGRALAGRSWQALPHSPRPMLCEASGPGHPRTRRRGGRVPSPSPHTAAAPQRSSNRLLPAGSTSRTGQGASPGTVLPLPAPAGLCAPPLPGDATDLTCKLFA